MNIIIEEVVSEFPIEILEEIVQINISDAVSYFDIVEVADTSFVGKDGYVPVVDEATGKLFLSPQQAGPGGGVPEAPNNSNAYVRSGLSWVIGYAKTTIDNLLSGKFNNPIGNNTQYLDGTGTPTAFPSIPSISGLVPYTGATQDVELGAFGLNAKFVKIKGTAGAGHLNLKHQSSNATAGGQETALFAGSDGELYYKNDGLTLQQIASRSWVQSLGYWISVNANNLVAGISKLYNTIGTETDGGITPNAVKVGLDSKANLTQVGNLLREEFTFSGSQTFTLANNYGQVYSVEVQGQGALSNSQYTLVAPNQITINDTLDIGDYIVVIYSNAIAGIQPYYSQAEVDAFLSLKANNFYSLKVTTPSAYVTGTLSETEVLRVEIPANTFRANDIIKIPTCDFNKLGANGTWQTRIKLTTSPTMPAGATGTIALSPVNGATTLYGNFTRSFKINGGNLKGYSFLGGSFLDTSTSLNVSSVAFDHTVTQYLYVSVTLSNIADQVRLEGIQLTNY